MRNKLEKGASAPFFFDINKSRLCSLGLNYLQKPNALEKIEQRLDEAEQSQSVLTENEKKLKTEAQTKEWEEIDEKTIIPLPKPK